MQTQMGDRIMAGQNHPGEKPIPDLIGFMILLSRDSVGPFFRQRVELDHMPVESARQRDCQMADLRQG